MRYSFKCPKCHRANYYDNKPHGDSYYPNLECQRCGQTGIAWVESEEYAGGTTSKPDLVAIGYETSKLDFLETEKTTYHLTKVAIPLLEKHATLVSQYDQGQRGNHFTPGVAGIQNGQCAGQVLHWIRRVLQGGREGYHVPHLKGGQTRTDEQLYTHQKKQHMAGAATHLLLNNQKANSNHLAEFDRKIDQIMQGRPGFYKQNGAWTFGSCPEEERQKRQAVLDKIAQSRAEESEKNVKGGFYAYGWEKLKRDLDEMMNRKFGGTSRPFSNIVALRCLNRTDNRFEDGKAETFAWTIIKAPDLTKDRAAILSFGLLEGRKRAGHAMGVHVDSRGQYFFFEPNVGIFQCKSRDALRQTIETMLGPIWEEAGWEPDGTFGYAFFRKAGPEETKPHEKVVEYHYDAPKITAEQNSARGVIPNSGPGKSAGGGDKGDPVRKKKSLPKMLKAVRKKLASKVSNIIHKIGGKHGASKHK